MCIHNKKSFFWRILIAKFLSYILVNLISAGLDLLDSPRVFLPLRPPFLLGAKVLLKPEGAQVWSPILPWPTPAGSPPWA